MLEAYNGDYLAEHAYIWAEAERERLRARCYENLVAMLKEEYDTQPSDGIQTWYEEWTKQITYR